MKATLFDMDGVLVDVRRSYDEAVRATVRRFSGAGISSTEIARARSRGGLNNDWDLAAAVLKDRGASVERDRVVRVFQELLLGDAYNGLIRNEAWMLRRDVLEVLSQERRLGIVTGRSAAEAFHTLRRFDVLRFFPAVITADDVPPGREKPDPLGLRLALCRLEADGGCYAGDGVDDMRAALAAGLFPLGVVPGRAGRFPAAALLASGARAILTDINRIGEVLK